MQRLRGLLFTGVVGALALLGAGCNQEKVLELQKEVDRLNVIKMNYEKDVRGLMEQVDELKVKSAQAQEDVAGRDKQIALLMEELTKAPKAAPTRNQMTTAQTQRIRYIAEEVGGQLIGNRILLPGDFLFRSGSWALTAGAKLTLKKISQVLDPETMRLVLKIVGHTDNEPIKRLRKKGIQSNRQLSLRRSLAVLEYLSKSCGYPPELMYPTGWGELDPVSSNKQSSGRKRNRRVEIFIDPELSNLTKTSGITEVRAVEGAAVTGGIQALPMAEEVTPKKMPSRFTK